MDLPNNPTPLDVWRAFQQIGPIATGRALVAVEVGTTETAIPHYLERVPQHWFELSPQDGADAVLQSSPPDETNLYLIAAGAVSADLWVW